MQLKKVYVSEAFEGGKSLTLVARKIAAVRREQVLSCYLSI